MQQSPLFFEDTYSISSQNYHENIDFQAQLIKVDDNLPQILPKFYFSSQTNLKQDKIEKKKINKKKQYDYHTKRRRNQKKQQELNPSFTNEEDKKILQLVIDLGPRFTLISKYFDDRSQNAIKNRYYKYLRFSWDKIFGSEYEYMNHKEINTETSILIENEINDEISEINQAIEKMHFFPDIATIMKNLVGSIERSMNEFI